MMCSIVWWCLCVCIRSCEWSEAHIGWLCAHKRLNQPVNVLRISLVVFFYNRVLHVSCIRGSECVSSEWPVCPFLRMHTEYNFRFIEFIAIIAVSTYCNLHILQLFCHCLVVALHAVFFVFVIITLRCYCWLFFALIYLSIWIYC